MDSIRKSECYNEKCTFNHIKGTRRQPPLVKNKQQDLKLIPSSSPPSPSKAETVEPTKDDNQAGHFLEVVRLLKAEIISTMNTQIANLTAKIQGIQQVQAQMPPHQIPYQQPAIFPPQFPVTPQLLFTPQVQGTQQQQPPRIQTPARNLLATSRL